LHFNSKGTKDDGDKICESVFENALKSFLLFLNLIKYHFMATAKKILIITGDAGESFEILYASHRLREEGYIP
jgi:hypothetical protein